MIKSIKNLTDKYGYEKCINHNGVEITLSEIFYLLQQYDFQTGYRLHGGSLKGCGTLVNLETGAFNLFEQTFNNYILQIDGYKIGMYLNKEEMTAMQVNFTSKYKFFLSSYDWVDIHIQYSHSHTGNIYYLSMCFAPQ